jgi:hypothetical protein
VSGTATYHGGQERQHEEGQHVGEQQDHVNGHDQHQRGVNPAWRRRDGTSCGQVSTARGLVDGAPAALFLDGRDRFPNHVLATIVRLLHESLGGLRSRQRPWPRVSSSQRI